jgi:hypothetical protein
MGVFPIEDGEFSGTGPLADWDRIRFREFSRGSVGVNLLQFMESRMSLTQHVRHLGRNNVSGRAAVIEAHARSRLRESVYPRIRQVRCEYRDGVLTLRGQVPSFFQKQIAQTLLRGLQHKVHINNRLVVSS